MQEKSLNTKDTTDTKGGGQPRRNEGNEGERGKKKEERNEKVESRKWKVERGEWGLAALRQRGEA
jgi:hypothetical protein